MHRILTPFLLLGFVIHLGAQQETTSSEIYHKLKGLNVLGSVLYVAAHPDDENTRLISHFANAEHYHTTYISLTRGDGGQNLIGTELRELLGVLRTQELLAARSIDGGKQMFSRANDFGYSKHPDETLRIWDSLAVMGDLVRAVRKTRPDIVVNRFDHRTKGVTHGHHTSSAILSYDVFGISGDPSEFPDLAEKYGVWQPKRVFFNTSWWFYGSRENFAKADKTNLTAIDVGTYFPLLGTSSTELAGRSRSMHKCQGFGNAGSRGKLIEYIEWVKGEKPETDNPMEGVNTTWSRVNGGDRIQPLVDRALEKYDYADPSSIVPLLFEIRDMIEDVEDEFWRDIKLDEVDDLIASCLGLYAAARADDEFIAQGDSLAFDLEIVNRSGTEIVLKSARLPWSRGQSTERIIGPNEKFEQGYSMLVEGDWRLTNPYWLNEKGELGIYKVPHDSLIGLPETPNPLMTKVVIEVDGNLLNMDIPIEYSEVDPVKAEIRKPLFIMPAVAVTQMPKSILATGDEEVSLDFRVKNFKPDFKGKLMLEADDDWDIEPKFIELDMAKAESEELVTFRLKNTAKTSKTVCRIVVVDEEGKEWDRSLSIIDYDHIPTQKVLMAANLDLIKLDMEVPVKKVGYVKGAGDEIPTSLRKIGIQVVELDEDAIKTTDLDELDAIIMGVRIVNVDDRLQYYLPELWKYAVDGGNLIWQYNTSRRLKTKDFLPYGIDLSRDRVAEEDAEVRIVEPDHVFFHQPNRITKDDFDDWVQERGLYFPDSWDERYVAPLSMNDSGESPKQGSLLIAPYGKGNLVYSGLSWFRELPAAVPGAYKMFVNLMALPDNEN